MDGWHLLLLSAASLCGLALWLVMRLIDRWNANAASMMSAEQRAPDALALLRHSVVELEPSTTTTSRAQRSAEARAARLDATNEGAADAGANLQCRDVPAAARAASPPGVRAQYESASASASASDSPETIRRHEARLAELRHTFSRRSWLQHPFTANESLSPTSGLTHRRKDASLQLGHRLDHSSTRSSRTSSSSRTAFVEEIGSDEEPWEAVVEASAAGERTAAERLDDGEAAAARDSTLFDDDDDELSEAVVLGRARELVALLAWDVPQPSAAVASPSSPLLHPSLHASLCSFASLLSRLSSADLCCWSSDICHTFLDAGAFDRLQAAMTSARTLHQLQLRRHGPVDVEEAERALEIAQAAELVLHTLVPLVWSQTHAHAYSTCRGWRAAHHREATGESRLSELRAMGRLTSSSSRAVRVSATICLRDRRRLTSPQFIPHAHRVQLLSPLTIVKAIALRSPPKQVKSDSFLEI